MEIDGQVEVLTLTASAERVSAARVLDEPHLPPGVMGLPTELDIFEVHRDRRVQATPSAQERPIHKQACSAEAAGQPAAGGQCTEGLVLYGPWEKLPDELTADRVERALRHPLRLPVLVLEQRTGEHGVVPRADRSGAASSASGRRRASGLSRSTTSAGGTNSRPRFTPREKPRFSSASSTRV